MDVVTVIATGSFARSFETTSQKLQGDIAH